MTDYYEILGVSPNSDAVAIRAAFKAMILKCHPDRNKSADALAKTKELNEAFAILGDLHKRASYDLMRVRASGQSATTTPSPSQSPPPPPTRKPGKAKERAAQKVQPKTQAKPPYFWRLAAALVVSVVVLAAYVGNHAMNGDALVVRDGASSANYELAPEADAERGVQPIVEVQDRLGPSTAESRRPVTPEQGLASEATLEDVAIGATADSPTVPVSEPVRPQPATQPYPEPDCCKDVHYSTVPHTDSTAGLSWAVGR